LHISILKKKVIVPLMAAMVLTMICVLGVSASSYTSGTFPGPTGYSNGATPPAQQGAQAGYTPTVFSGSANLRVSGSTTIYPIVHDFVTTYGATDLPGITADVEQGGSGWGRDDVGLGWGDVADSSSSFPTTGGLGINSSEHPMFVVTKIARDAVCVIVNSDVTGITHITKSQIASIYDDKTITNWDQITDQVTQVTGPNLPIKFFARELGSGTRASLGDQCSFTNKDPVTGEYGDEVAKMTALGGTRETSNELMQAAINTSDGSGNGGIGYVGLGFSVNSDGTPLDHAVELQVVSSGTTAYAPTTANIYTAAYPLSRWLQVGTLNDYQSQNYANGQTLINGLKGYDGQQAVLAEHFDPLYLAQDVNHNGKVNSTDIGAIGSAWNSKPGDANWNAWADVNHSGQVTSTDVGSIGLWWNFDYSSNTP